MACGEPSSKKEKADSAGDTRPWSRLATVKVRPAGVGKSLAVGVGTRGDGGEIDLDLVDEGMLQVHVWGSGYAGLTRGDAGLRGVSNERVSQDMDVFRLQRTSIWQAEEMKLLDSYGRIKYTGKKRKESSGQVGVYNHIEGKGGREGAQGENDWIILLLFGELLGMIGIPGWKGRVGYVIVW